MAFNYSASGLVAFSMVMMALGIVSTVFRFWSRAVVLQGDYRWDDWLALVAVVFLTATPATTPILQDYGAGEHLVDLSRHDISQNLVYYYADSILNTLGLTFAKLSELSFYIRIFGFRHSGLSWKISICANLFFVLAFPAWVLPVTIWQCSPIQHIWQPWIPGHCLGSHRLKIAAAAYNAAVDILILLQPLPELCKLNMSTRKKMYLAAAFIVGYSVPLVSLGRLVVVAILNDKLITDFTHAVIPMAWWLQAESGIVVVVISLPPIYQLCARFARFGPRSLFNSRQYSRDNIRNRSYSSESECRIQFGSKPNLAPQRWHGADSELFLATQNELVGLKYTQSKASARQGSIINTPDTIHLPVPDHIRVSRKYQVTYDTCTDDMVADFARRFDGVQ